MKSVPKVLVVDDEPVVCESCTRIFSDQGFEVETRTDSREGLRRASEENFSAILVDLKMPELDGHAFIAELRKRNQKVPVIMITGFPSGSSEASAIRLGATDFVAKPFTPEEIILAVRRLTMRPHTDTLRPPASTETACREQGGVSTVPRRKERLGQTAAPMIRASPDRATTHTPEQWLEKAGDYWFLDEAWMRKSEDGATVLAGIYLAPSEWENTEAVELPRVGDSVRQGLPMACIRQTGKPARLVPAPISGEVVEVNARLQAGDCRGWDNPCREGWLARIRPTQFEKALPGCAQRHVLVACTDVERTDTQADRLSARGCKVHLAGTAEDVLQAIKDTGSEVVFLDGPSYGEEGPTLVHRINEAHPAVRVVVVAEPSAAGETAYRMSRILFYAVGGLADAELTEILGSAFRPVESARPLRHVSSALPRWVHRIRTTNRHGETISLLAAREILTNNQGVGQQLIQMLLDAGSPIQVDLGAKKLLQMEVLRESSDCDRLLILMAADTNRLPGSVTREVWRDITRMTGETADKVVTLTVQPPSAESSALNYDRRTNQTLASMLFEALTNGL